MDVDVDVDVDVDMDMYVCEAPQSDPPNRPDITRDGHPLQPTPQCYLRSTPNTTAHVEPTAAAFFPGSESALEIEPLALPAPPCAPFD